MMKGFQKPIAGSNLEALMGMDLRLWRFIFVSETKKLMRTFLIILGSLLWALQAQGAPRNKPPQPVTHIDVLCEALNAHIIETPFSFFTPVKNFEFLPYDTDLEILPLDGSRLLKGLDGTLELDVSPNPPLEVSLAPLEAEKIQELMKNSDLIALAAFRPKTSLPLPCKTRIENGRKIYRLAVDLRIVEILHHSTQRPLLRYQADIAFAQSVNVPQGTTLEVLFTEPAVLKGELVPERMLKAANRLLPHLKRCYAKGLQTNRLAQGTLTIQLLINRRGGVEGVDITIDTFGDENLHRCVIEEILQARYPRPAKGPAAVSFTVYFKQKQQ